MRERAQRVLVMVLGAAFTLPACLDLGGSWDATSAVATSATTTASSSSTSGTMSGTTTGTSTSAATTTGMTTSTTTGSTSTAPVTGEAEDCPPGESFCCDPLEQDCPGGKKCMPWADDGGNSWNAWGCFPVVPDPDHPGEPCTMVGGATSGVDSCVKGAMCFGVDPETNEGICFAICTGPPDDPQCVPGFSCAITADATLILCLPWCDPLVQDCPGDDLCIPIYDDFICVSDASGEEGQYGDACEWADGCDPGLICLNPEYVPDCKGRGCCSPFCDSMAPNTCPGKSLGQECIAWFEEGQAPVGFGDVGFCGVPQP